MMNELIALLRRLVAETTKEDIKLKALALIKELEGSFKSPGGFGDQVIINVQRKTDET